MPELPDVDGFRRVLAEHAPRREVVATVIHDRELLRNRSPQSLGRALKGRRFREPERRGKWLFAPIDDVVLLMHFGMTGLLAWEESDSERHRHDRIVFRCRGGELRYRNMRRFGGIWVARDEAEAAAVTGRLGPDAGGLSRKGFEELLEHRRGGIKAALLDQRLIAGLGNLLVDEILWTARVHPESRSAHSTACGATPCSMRFAAHSAGRSRPDACPACAAGSPAFATSVMPAVRVATPGCGGPRRGTPDPLVPALPARSALAAPIERWA